MKIYYWVRVSFPRGLSSGFRDTGYRQVSGEGLSFVTAMRAEASKHGFTVVAHGMDHIMTAAEAVADIKAAMAETVQQ